MARLITIIIGGAALAFLCFRCLSSHPTQIQTDLGGKATAALNASAFGWATVDMDGRDLRLTGVAPDESARRTAERLVSNIAGVRTVQNSLQLMAIRDSEPPIADVETGVDLQADTAQPSVDRGVIGDQPDAAGSAETDAALVSCQEEFDQLLGSGQIRFGSNRAIIDSSSLPLLQDLRDVAGRCPGARIEIAGHTDSSGRAVYNLSLSQQRAAAVRDYLVTAGVDPARLTAKGYGETRPIADNASAAGRAANRRIEFIIEGQQP